MGMYMDGDYTPTTADAISFRAILDAAPVAIQIVGQNGLFIDCNRRTGTMFGASSLTEIIGKAPAILSPEIQSNGIRSETGAHTYIERALKGETVTFGWEHRRFNGELFPATVTLSPIAYQDTPCLMASISDCSFEKQILIENELTTEVQTLFQGIRSAIMVISPDLKVMDVNPAFERITGYTREQGIGMTLKDFRVLDRQGATVSDVIHANEPKGGSIIAEFPSGIRHVDYMYIPVKGLDGSIKKFYEVFYDKTELINQIHESESLIAGNPAAIITTDLQGNILTANPAFIELTRFSSEKILSMSIKDFNIINREGGRVDEMIQKKELIQGRMTVDFNDFIKILNYTYVPVLDVNGHITSLILMYIDITEELQKIDEINALIQDSPYGIITIDNELKILDLNHAFVEITGFSREQGMKMNLKDFKIRERNGSNLEDARKTGKPASGKMIIDLPTGVKHLNYTYIPVHNRRGEITRFFEIFADITELVNQINESEALVSSSPASILTMDTTGKILSLNQAFVDVCRLPREKILSMNIADFSITERTGGSFKDVLNTKKPVKGRLTVDFGSHSRILDFTYIPLLDVNGMITSLVAMYIDLTEQVRLIKYLDDSVILIADAITKLASGNTQFEITIQQADDTTRRAYENMTKISSTLETARDAVARLVRDTTDLADQAVAGDLRYRADASGHQGDYQKVISGVNQIMDSITGPVNEAMRVAASYAAYDFTTRVDPSCGIVGDWISFRKALDDIGQQVGEAIVKITNEVTRLSASSEMADASVREIATGAGQLAKNAGVVSANAEQGKDGISQVLRAMEDLSVTVGDVSQKTEEVASLSQNSNELARSGTELARKADDGMKVITANSEETARIIAEIQQEMGQIGKIVKLITDIASQTNLLALNAAIEAARAGEAGRGFAVVASEVKSLATESRNSAENISEMITSLQKKSESASRAVSLATSAVNDGNQALNETLTVFGQLASAVEEISEYMEQVASMSEEQAANAEEIAASVNEVSDLMQGTADEAVNMAGITEETSVSLEQLKEIINNVQSVAQGVSGAVTRFRI